MLPYLTRSVRRTSGYVQTGFWEVRAADRRLSNV